MESGGLNFELLYMYFGIAPILAILAAIWGFGRVIYLSRKSKKHIQEIESKWMQMNAEVKHFSLERTHVNGEDTDRFIPSIQYEYTSGSERHQGDKFAWYQPKRGYLDVLIKPMTKDVKQSSFIKIYCNPLNPSESCVLPVLDYEHRHQIMA